MKLKKIINVYLIQRPQWEDESLLDRADEIIFAIQDRGNEAVLHFNSNEEGLSILVEEVTYMKKSKSRNLPHAEPAK